MNMLNTSARGDFLKAAQAQLLSEGFASLREFACKSAQLSDALSVLGRIGDENIARRVNRLNQQLESFEPSVTMIGQIKSGKTSLVNALIGQPDLLPADVNPWTSVVTSLHLHPETEGFENSASFEFFEEDEWDRLISGGGRIGELASRAGAEDELEKIKRQVAQMREKSRARLGRKFEVLLGQKRDYGYFDKELIERYVCLGDDLSAHEEAVSKGQGRFADITRSADLYLQRVSLPTRLCLRDTPGVNDTFMMREQITIKSIRDSRICVVVLSAHQALSSTDLALIRLISLVKTRDIIIFVNRIDELSDPATQVPQIEASIRKTLERHKGPLEAEVIFGSALWATRAFEGDISKLPKTSGAALRNWARGPHGAGPDGDQVDPVAQAWILSGVPALQAALSDRVIEGIGAATLERIAGSGLNLANGIAAANRLGRASPDAAGAPPMDRVAARARFAELSTSATAALKSALSDLRSSFSERLDRVQSSFLERATASLVVHLEKHGEKQPWTYDPAGLRVLLSSSHQVFARKSQATFDEAVQAVATQIADLYAQAFALGPEHIRITLPAAPQVPPPVTLGRTIALDLQGSWWKRWWVQRRGYDAYAASFYDLIKAETQPIVDELGSELALGVSENAAALLRAFLKEQQSVFETLDRMRDADPAALETVFADATPQQREADLTAVLKTLNTYGAV